MLMDDTIRRRIQNLVVGGDNKMCLVEIENLE